MEDSQIIELYWQRKDEAIAHTDKKYGPYCFSIAHNILQDRQDSEECINDTWLRAWHSIPPQRPNVLKLFLARITRNLAINRYHARNTEKRGSGQVALVLEELAECVSDSVSPEHHSEAKELEGIIAAFVWALPEKEGNVFVRRYFFTESVAEIAGRYDLTENNVMVLLSRTRKKLKTHLRKEGYFHE